jgi:hypothetical protein
MSVLENDNAFVDPTAVSIGLARMFTVTPANNDPTYLVLNVLDRNEYTVGASGATGSLGGNGHTLQLSGIGTDGRGAGIVFTYQMSSGRYYNGTYGYFDQLTYNSSGSLGDVTNLSLFGTNSLGTATSGASNAYSMMQTDAAGYLGSATVVTSAKSSGTVPAQATPNSIASVAESFVGQAWNMNGCWVLASTIAADAGASLPVQTTAIGVPGMANGEWIVAFNGPAGQSANWESLVKAGEIIVIGNAGGGGHITTCVSGSGANAMLVDNVTYVNGSGQVSNLANDGSTADIVVAASHPASREWSGVAASTVVIYELDTPIVADAVASGVLAPHASEGLGSLFTVSDPAGKTITQWQVYDTASSNMLVVGGSDYGDHSAAAALTVASLSSVSLLAGALATNDTIEVRAYNGTYWGDWQPLSISIGGATAAAPVSNTQTPAQTWSAGSTIALATYFIDPQGEGLTYSAALSSGQALPAWLTFNATTGAFSGTAPTAAQTLSIVVTARDTSAQTGTDTFSAIVLGTPVLAAQTPNQTWTEGKAVSLALSVNTFTDPQAEQLAYGARLTSGQPLPSWLSFNATTDTFSGTAPLAAQSLSIKVTATDSGGLAASETFTAGVQPAAPVSPKPGITVSGPTPKQTWTDGQSVALVLPSNTFTDVLGLQMTFAAYEVSGPTVVSWLHFNPTTEELYGTVPSNASGTLGLEVIAFDARNMSATDLFSVTLASNSAHGAPAAAIAYGPVSMPAAVTVLGMLSLHS